MEINTFGSFPVAHLLVNKLEELNNKKITNKVSKFIIQYQTGLSQLNKFSDKKGFDINSKIYMTHVWKNDFLQRVNFHPEIDSLIRNIIVAYSRKFVDNIGT